MGTRGTRWLGGEQVRDGWRSLMRPLGRRRCRWAGMCLLAANVVCCSEVKKTPPAPAASTAPPKERKLLVFKGQGVELYGFRLIPKEQGGRHTIMVRAVGAVVTEQTQPGEIGVKLICKDGDGFVVDMDKLVMDPRYRRAFRSVGDERPFTADGFDFGWRASDACQLDLLLRKQGDPKVLARDSICFDGTPKVGACDWKRAPTAGEVAYAVEDMRAEAAQQSIDVRFYFGLTAGTVDDAIVQAYATCGRTGKKQKGWVPFWGEGFAFAAGERMLLRAKFEDKDWKGEPCTVELWGQRVGKEKEKLGDPVLASSWCVSKAGAVAGACKP